MIQLKINVMGVEFDNVSMEEALDAAFGLVEALRLRQQENGAEAHTEETKHEE